VIARQSRKLMGRQVRNIRFDEKIARRLKYERAKNRMLQKDVAKLIGLGVTSIQNHERGDYPHGLYNILKYCKIYKLSISEFLEGITID
jgi:DNA-binding XRE family transcriptional regulator